MISSLEKLAVLIVENEFLLAVNLETTMREAGASVVETAASLADARVLVEQREFDAAILDIRLMDGNSLPLAQELTERGVPVVIHSGHAKPSDCSMVPEAVFLPKPSTPTEIVRSVLRARGVPGAFDLPRVALSQFAGAES